MSLKSFSSSSVSPMLARRPRDLFCKGVSGRTASSSPKTALKSRNFHSKSTFNPLSATVFSLTKLLTIISTDNKLGKSAIEMSEKPGKRKLTPTKPTLLPTSSSSPKTTNDLLPCKIQRTYQCPKCNLVTRNPRDYLYHLRDEHGEKLKVFECKHCIYASRHPQKLQRHIGFIHPTLDDDKMASPPTKKRRNTKRPASLSPVRVKIDDEMTSSDEYGRNFEVEEFFPAVKSQFFDENEEEQEQENVDFKDGDDNSDFKCTICDFKGKTKMAVDRHERENHLKRNLFRCLQCGFVTHKQGRYVKHLKYHSLPCLECEMCDFKTPYQWNLDRHLKNHNAGAIFRCKMCSFAANSKQSLTLHVMNHHEDGNDKNNFLASIGLVSYSNTQQEDGELGNSQGGGIKIENKGIEDDGDEIKDGGGSCEFYQKKGRWYRRMLTCSRCSFSSTSANELQEHEIQHRQDGGGGGKNGSELPARQRLNLRARNLLRKVSKDVPSDSPRRCNVGNKPLKCKLCSYEAKWMSELMKHNRIHTQEKPFTCNHCGFRSRWKGDMTRHVQKYHNEDLDLISEAGVIPKKRIKTKKDGGGLKNQDEEEEENGDFFVDEMVVEEEDDRHGFKEIKSEIKDDGSEENVVNQRPSSSSSLHILRKCYRCPHCDFTASTASRFHVHIVAHLNQRPFMCSDCGYRSNWQWDVTKHIRLKSSHQESHTNASMVMVNEFAHRDYESYNKYIIYEDNPYTEDKRTPITVKMAAQSDEPNKNRQNIWKCIQCAFKCFSKQGILHHLPSHSVDRPFFCGECGQSSKWRSVIEAHCHARHGNLTCIIENKNVVESLDGRLEEESNAYDDTSEQEGFIKEVVTDSSTSSPVVNGNITDEDSTSCFVTTTKTTPKGDPLKWHACNMCPYQTKKMFDMKMHLRLHKPQPGAIFKCMFCPFYTSLRRSLLNHMKLHVNEPQEYIFKAMQTNNNNNNNNQNEDDGDVDYDNDENCDDDLDGTFEMDPPPIVEQKPVPVTVGEGEAAMFVSVQMKRYSCDHCPYTSNSKTQYLYHKQFHRTTKMAPFKCPHCTYSVTKSHLLLQHLKLHKKASGSNEGTSPKVVKKQVKEKETVLKDGDDMKPTPPAVMMAAAMMSSDVASKKQAIPLVWIPKSGGLVKMFKCRFCPHVNKRRSNIREHEKMHRKRKIGSGRFSCPHCTYTCNNQGVLSSHVKVHQPSDLSKEQKSPNWKDLVDETLPTSPAWSVPQKNGIFLCDLCPAKFPRPSNAVVHRRFHGAPLAWKCTHCNYAARHRPHLHRHLKVHSLEYQSKLKKSLEAMSRSPMKDEFLGVHATSTPKWEKKHCCHLCPAAFLKVSSLAYHLSLHGGSGKFKCQHCDYAVKNCGNLVRHSKIHDALRKTDDWSVNSMTSPRHEKKRLVCVKCPATFDKYSRYDVHMKLHGSNQRFTCKMCDYSVKFMANLLKHQRMHEECAPQQSLLQQHHHHHQQQQQQLFPMQQKIEHDDLADRWRPHLDFDQSIVETTVKLSLSEQQMLMLLQHQQQMVQQQRLGEDAKRLFYCDRCPYQHSRKDAVLSHLKRHRGTQDMTCRYCDYSTTLASFLREHTKLHFQPQKRQRIESYLKWEGMQVWMTNPSGENSAIFDDDVASDDNDLSATTLLDELPLEVIVKTEEQISNGDEVIENGEIKENSLSKVIDIEEMGVETDIVDDISNLKSDVCDEVEFEEVQQNGDISETIVVTLNSDDGVKVVDVDDQKVSIELGDEIL